MKKYSLIAIVIFILILLSPIIGIVMVLTKIVSQVPKTMSTGNSKAISNQTISSITLGGKPERNEDKPEDLSLDNLIRLYGSYTTTVNVGSIVGTAYSQKTMLVAEPRIIQGKSREEFQIEESYQPDKLVIKKEDNKKG